MKIWNLRHNLGQSGFSHLIVALFGVLVIGLIGGAYVYVSHADTNSKALSEAQKCKNAGGVWLSRSEITTHGPCWSTAGAYLVNFGTGATGDGIDQLGDGESERMNYPNYIIAVSGKWKACIDLTSMDDPCTETSFIGKKAVNLCSKEYVVIYHVKFGLTTHDEKHSAKLCAKKSVYIKRF